MPPRATATDAAISMKPIGFVRTGATEEELRTNRKNIQSEIVVNKKFARGLEGIDGYSHIFVLFWLHRVTDEMRMRLDGHMHRHDEASGLGVFATRGRNRPNPMGLAVVELLGREGNVLKVKALDALDGTPVLDLKPYDYIDRKDRIRVPDWWMKAHPRSLPRRAEVSGGGAPAQERQAAPTTRPVRK